MKKSEKKIVRWGVIGTGRVSNDFVLSLKHVEEAEIVMCAARSAEKAKAFASTHGIASFGKSYDDIYKNEDILALRRSQNF